VGEDHHFVSNTVGLDGDNVRADASSVVTPHTTPPSVDVASAPTVETHEWPFEFRGVTAEYFRIWIVNLALSIVTLGIFSAWAKVRRERYFYGNTWVAGAPFEYLADPLNILKGRVVAVTVFALYVLLQQTMPIAQALLLLFVLIATPWIITSALRFRARYSAWNAATFRFTGTVRAAVKYYLVLGVLMIPTIGLIYPYMRGRQRRFMVEGHRFGGHPFEFGGTMRDFYVIFGIASLIGIVTVAVGIGVGAASNSIVGGMQQFPRLLFNLLRYGPAGLGYLAIFLGYVYVASRVTNLSYNTARFGSHRFRSTIRMRDLVAIYLTNTIAIVASIGLLVPWAQIRLARYRANHLTLLAHGDVRDLALESGGERNAFGAETANVFDLDISL
jgi:uncharacterized membrane protein YjgN (DUF898 family)